MTPSSSPSSLTSTSSTSSSTDTPTATAWQQYQGLVFALAGIVTIALAAIAYDLFFHAAQAPISLAVANAPAQEFTAVNPMRAS